LNDYHSHLMRSRYSAIQRQLSKKAKLKNSSRLSAINEGQQSKRQSNGDVYYMAESLNENDEPDIELEESNSEFKGAKSEESYSDIDDRYSKLDENAKNNKFTGYLNEKSASYNLYLRVGIGGKSLTILTLKR
jgi:hypothetical protein